MTAPRIITIGHSALDFVYRIDAFPTRPTKMRATGYTMSGGGMAANAAAAAARLGGQVAHWSRIGDDIAGAAIVTELQRDGVETASVRAFPGLQSATAAVIVDAAGERLVVSQHDAQAPLDSSWLPLHLIKDAGAVLSDLSWLEGTRAAFTAARGHGVPTIIDMDIGAGRLIGDVVDVADYVIASAQAFDSFLTGADTDARLDGLISQGVRHAGVTRGAQGYTWKNARGQSGRQPAFQVEVVDTTGAGDAFHGAFAWALASGGSDDHCARIASAVAALKCRKLGARAGLPTRRELDAFLAQHSA